MFNRDKRSKDGKRPECKGCHRKDSKQYRDGHLEQAAERWVSWRESNPKKYILWRAKQQARIKSREFNLTEEDIELATVCPILGVELRYHTAEKNDPNAASLDRIDSSKGYVKGNVTIMSRRANTIKNDATLEEIERVYSWMKENQ